MSYRMIFEDIHALFPLYRRDQGKVQTAMLVLDLSEGTVDVRVNPSDDPALAQKEHQGLVQTVTIDPALTGDDIWRFTEDQATHLDCVFSGATITGSGEDAQGELSSSAEDAIFAICLAAAKWVPSIQMVEDVGEFLKQRPLEPGQDFVEYIRSLTSADGEKNAYFLNRELRQADCMEEVVLERWAAQFKAGEKITVQMADLLLEDGRLNGTPYRDELQEFAGINSLEEEDRV